VGRAVRNALALLRARVAGVTLVSVDRWTLAEELWSSGEDELHLAALDLSDEDMVRVWRLAGRLYMDDVARSAGQAAALAAVSVLEGRRRPLARKRRRPGRDRLHFPQTIEERVDEVHRIEDSESFPPSWR
jgi:hypothetical protein